MDTGRWRGRAALTLLIAALAASGPAGADWRDWLNVLKPEQAAPAVSALADSEVAEGLRAALGQGVERAVNRLGQPGGFLDDPAVRIPVPRHLEMVEKGLRTIGQDGVADAFVESLNRAAERAVPEAASVFGGAVSRMSIEDARAILDGGDTAATDYLRASSTGELRERFRPLVEEAVQGVGVTRQYQQLVDKAGPLASVVDTDRLDLPGYVTEQALDGVYRVVGEEERRIRENPAARTSELLKKVFGR